MPKAFEDHGMTAHILDLLASWTPEVVPRRMFGGVGLFAYGRMFAIIIDDVLYLKDARDENGELIQYSFEKEYFEYNRGEKVVQLGYYRAPDFALEEGSALAELAKQSWASAKVNAKKPRKSKKSLLVGLACLAACSALSALSAMAAAPKVSPTLFFFDPAELSKKARVLNFPENISLGAVTASVNPYTTDKGDINCMAKGKVTIPAGRFSRFVPAHHFFENPAIIKTFSPDSFDSLSLTASSLDDSEDGMCDRALRVVGHLKGLLELKVDRSDCSDKGAEHLVDFPKVERFSAFLTPIEGSCFKSFATCKKLRFITMQSSPIKDENLRFLGAIPNLSFLDLSMCGVTDVGVKQLPKCQKLITLDLTGCKKITDASIADIRALKNLAQLRIGGTSITARGIMGLKGLPMEAIVLPASSYPPATMQQFRQIFPKSLIIPNPKRGAVDDETKTIYAPLH